MSNIPKILGGVLLLALAAACAQPHQTEPITPTSPEITPVAGNFHINDWVDKRITGASLSDDQAVLEVFVQPTFEFMPWMETPITYNITVTLPAEVKLIEGDLNWKTTLERDETFTEKIVIGVGELDSVVEIKLVVVFLFRNSPPFVVVEDTRLFLRRGLEGRLEFSNDYYFGGPIILPTPGFPVTVMPNDPRIVNDSSGVEQKPRTTLTGTPVPKITATPTITQPPKAYP